MQRILFVEDDPEIGQLISSWLGRHDMDVTLEPRGDMALARVEAEQPDLVLLDINLPGQDGLSLARELRARDPAIGIILVTSRNDDIDKVVGLEVGADDYVTKPFNPRELLARVKSLLRRTGGRHDDDEEVFRFAGWTLNLPRRRLCDPQGADVALTRGEFEALALLVRYAGEVINRDRLSRAISGHDWSPQDRTVDVLVRRLRTKLDGADKPDSLISTVRGEGYRLAVDAERARS